MPLQRLASLLVLATALSAVGAQKSEIPINYDEAKMPPYTLPDPLVASGGARIRDAATWQAQRRSELLELFAREVYGRTPGGRPRGMHWVVTSADRAALGGNAGVDGERFAGAAPGDLPLGQRVEAFAVDAWRDGRWVEVAAGTSIGSCRLLRFGPVATDRVRLRIIRAPVCPAIAELALF